MGGLVIRAAITGVQKHEAGWPPYLYIEDVSTLSTPHRGAPAAVFGCAIQNTQQCRDMHWSSDPTSRSVFFNWINENPQSAQAPTGH